MVLAAISRFSFTIYLRKFTVWVIIDAPCHAMNVIIVIVEISLLIPLSEYVCIFFLIPHKKYSFFSMNALWAILLRSPCFIHLSGGTLTKLSFWAIFFSRSAKCNVINVSCEWWCVCIESCRGDMWVGLCDDEERGVLCSVLPTERMNEYDCNSKR